MQMPLQSIHDLTNAPFEFTNEMFLVKKSSFQ